jgi:hypothetical protein
VGSDKSRAKGGLSVLAAPYEGEDAKDVSRVEHGVPENQGPDFDVHSIEIWRAPTICQVLQTVLEPQG